MSDKMFGGIKANSTSVSIDVVLRKKSDNTELTGIAFGTTGNIASYHRQGAARVAITLATQTVTGAWATGGFVEIDSTNQPGLYRLDVPDAAFASGVDFVTVSMVTTSGYTYHERFALSTDVIQTGDNFALIGTAGVGLTNLGDTRIAKLDANVSTRMATYTQPTGFLAATFPGSVGTSTYAGGAVASVTGAVGSVAAGGISTASFAVGAIDNTVLSSNAEQAIADKTLATAVDGTITLKQAHQLAMAALAGKISGANTTTVTIRDVNDTRNCIVATVDANGNRSALTLTVV